MKSANNLLDAILFETSGSTSGTSSFDMIKTLKDGSYEATVDGQEGPLTVSVTIAGGKISTVDVVENHETASVGGSALVKIPGAMVAANSPDVDSISGATLTSTRLRDSVVTFEKAAA